MALLTSTASATLVVYEPFNYDSAERVLGQSNPSTGTNWLLAGGSPPSIVITETTAINVASGNLSVPSILQPAVGNSATITGVGNLSGATNRLAFAPTGGVITSGTVYYSFALRVDQLTGSNNTNGGWLLGLNNSGNVPQASNPTVGMARMQARIDPADGTKFQLGVFNVNATAALMNAQMLPSLTVGQTYFIVAGYTFNPNAGDDVASLWINPGSLGATTPPAPVATHTGNDTGQIASILLRQSPAPYLTLDELRVGTDWASVTAIPEPSPFFVLLLASALFFAVRTKTWKLLGT